MRTAAVGFVLLASLSCASAAPRRASGVERAWGGAGVPASQATRVLVGVGASDITPEEPIRLTGYGNRSVPTADIRQRLHAKALAFSDARGRTSVLITSDLIGIPRHVSDELARRLASAGIRREQLAVSATHTHTGPMLAGNLEEYEKRAAEADANGLLARAMLARLGRGDAIPGPASYAIQVWTFADDLAMVFLAGEVVADYGLRLKRELDGSRLWVNAYTNDVPFYVASRRMIPERGYEVDRSMVYYGQPAPLAPQTEEDIIRTVLDLVPRAFARRR